MVTKLKIPDGLAGPYKKPARPVTTSICSYSSIAEGVVDVSKSYMVDIKVFDAAGKTYKQLALTDLKKTP